MDGYCNKCESRLRSASERREKRCNPCALVEINQEIRRRKAADSKEDLRQAQRYGCC